MGIVKKSRESNEIIQLNNYKIGDKYANVFAKNFKKTNQKILHLNMKNNKLQDEGAISILNNLNEYIVTIDLSLNNKMGVPAYKLLGERIFSNFFRLKKLSLDNNNISK